MNNLIPTKRVPEQGKRSFDCPRCGAFSGQKWHELKHESKLTRGTTYIRASDMKSQEGHIIGSGSPQPVGVPISVPYWTMSECDACGDCSVWRGSELAFPVKAISILPNDEMPEAIKELFLEAAMVSTVSTRAGAALARLTLESLLKYVDPKAPSKMNLEGRISRMSPELSSTTRKMLEVVRHVGNESAHSLSLDENSVLLVLSDRGLEFTPVIFGAINQIVDELIAKPKLAEVLYEALPDKVLNELERKSKSAH